MHYCRKCGAKVVENALFCVNCGEKQDVVIDNQNKQIDENRLAAIILGILGIVGSFLIVFAPISFVLSLVGLIIAISNNKKVKNKIGIILNSIGLGLSVLIIFFIFFVINTRIISSSDDNDNNYNNISNTYGERF